MRQLAIETLSRELVKLTSKHACVLGNNPLYPQKENVKHLDPQNHPFCPILMRMIWRWLKKYQVCSTNPCDITQCHCHLSVLTPHILGKGKRKRASKLSVIDLLETKFERKAQLKEKELEIRKMELELQKRKMDQDEEERKRAQEERQKRFELELAEKKSMLELIQKLASNK